MADEVVAGAADLGAGRVVVVLVTQHADAERQARRRAVVDDGVPVQARQNDAQVDHPLDQTSIICKSKNFRF